MAKERLGTVRNALPLLLASLFVVVASFFYIILPILNQSPNWFGHKPPAKEAVPVIKTYQNEGLGFSFNYPETLNLYHESDEKSLKSFYKEGERVPYLEVFLEEANGPAYQPQSTKEELIRGLFSLLPPFQSYSKPKKLVGYKVAVTVDRKWVSETLPVLTERFKDKLCADTAGETVSVTDTKIAGENARKITCGQKTTSYVSLDPNNGNHYLEITGKVTTPDATRYATFTKAYEELVSSFRFTNLTTD